MKNCIAFVCCILFRGTLSLRCTTVFILLLRHSNIQFVSLDVLFLFAAALKNEDVCKWETFRARCGEGEVIVVNSARYGRIKTGKCVQIEVGEQPCFNDAQLYLDKQCGGRRTCELSLPNRVLDEMPTFCSNQRISYLEVSYYCQAGRLAALRRVY